MRRAFALFAALALVASVGCRTPEVFSGWDSYVPGFGTTAEEKDLPSPDRTLKSEMPPVEGDWNAP